MNTTTEQLTELGFTVSGRVSRPVAEVYEAVADPAQLSRYFTTAGARGRLETGAEVTWDFADFPGAFPVRVVAAEPPRRIVIEWDGEHTTGERGTTTTTFEFEPRSEERRVGREGRARGSVESPKGRRGVGGDEGTRTGPQVDAVR